MSLDAHLALARGELDLDVELRAEAGRVLAILGPNGAGKSTILGAIAGTLALDGGRIALDGRVLDEPGAGRWLPPEARSVGLVPQDLLLFPHLSARENVAFGLRARGTAKAEARRRADGWLARFEVAELADQRPRQLSGGQAQRVALARALAVEPAALLLDEPLAALDAGTRRRTRRDLRRWLAGVEVATVLVTHDPVDALALADDVLVLEAGRATQAGPIAQVTARPRTPYVAELLGTNLVVGTAHGTELRSGQAVLRLAEPLEGPAFATVAPAAISLHRAEPEGSARNRWPVTVVEVEPIGDRVRVGLDGPLELVAEVTPAALADLGLVPGASAWASLKATEVVAYLR